MTPDEIVTVLDAVHVACGVADRAAVPVEALNVPRIGIEIVERLGLLGIVDGYVYPTSRGYQVRAQRLGARVLGAVERGAIGQPPHVRDVARVLDEARRPLAMTEVRRACDGRWWHLVGESLETLEQLGLACWVAPGASRAGGWAASAGGA